VDSVPIILESAYRHGVDDDDMLHALRFPLHHFAQDDGLVMFVGPARDGELIEVGVVEWYGEIVIAHAMRPARPKYL
jgi:hypothetical protein